MRIAISSTACNGKTTFIKSFLRKWPTYVKPEKTYRDLIESKGLSLNKEGTVESQRIIRDALSDQAIENSDVEHCIHDRCILDNLIYTLYLAETGKIDDDEFIGESFHITRETLKLYDVIFFLPLSKLSPINLEEREHRELDLVYRQSINTLFLEAQQSYKKREGLIFPLENSPAFIEIFGNEDNGEKTAMAGLYLQDDGGFKSTDESLMKTIEHAAENEALEQALLSQLQEE